MKTLKDILKEIEVINSFALTNLETIEVKGIEENSKLIKPGYVFVARKGINTNGEFFIEEVISKGAVAVLRETPPDRNLKISQFQIKNLKKSIFKILSNFYDNPCKALKLIGITGTNGKTSVSFFTKCLLDHFGVKTGYIGTLFYDIGEVFPSKETTPSLFTLFPLLKKLTKKNYQACVLEVSSHALSQDRISGIKFDICAFTNLSRDHLDYHKDMEDYFNAKKKLFLNYLKKEGTAVISLETSYGKRLAEELKQADLKKLFLVNDPEGKGDVNVEIVDRRGGLTLKVRCRGKGYLVKTQVFGDYQAKNIGTLWGVFLALGFEADEIAKRISQLKNPPGRLEVVSEFRGAKIVVDYAHTPSALEEALKSLQKVKEKRLMVLFGCGGNRDTGKRPLMGKVANKLADEIILTSDNPRFEDPLAIIEDIKRGLNGTKPLKVIPDRREALKQAIKELKKGDVLLVAGKGHEDYQEIKGKRIPFSDREEVLNIVKNLEVER
jgi:UDP-N-acetylmuramoyl-L-alanyl-D-glutamate--2,6-diaminopimelate ligase